MTLPPRRLPRLYRWLSPDKKGRRLFDPTLANSILDRLAHNAHRIEMKGDSMRKTRPPSTMLYEQRNAPAKMQLLRNAVILGHFKFCGTSRSREIVE
jgi:hypothetical protein